MRTSHLLGAQFAMDRRAISALSISAGGTFYRKSSGRTLRWVKLGIVLAQPMGYPQKRPMTGFCPRGGDSGARDRCTGFWRTQVCDSQGKKPVVHTKTGLLLLRLCIYRKHKKKTEGQLQRPERGALWRGRFWAITRPHALPAPS